MPAVIETYPDFEVQVRELVRQHLKLKNQRLHLAVYFAPPRRAKRDIFLFEVIDGFGGNEVDAGGKLFDFGYCSTPGFPRPAGTSVRMLLTNPIELDEAVRHNWKGVKALRAAREARRAIVIYADAKGKKLWEKVR